MSNPIQVRPPQEIQRAHDMLVAVLLDEVMVEQLGTEVTTVLDQMASTLCWVLNHRHNEKVSNTLQAIENAFRAEGLVLADSGKLSERDV